MKPTGSKPISACGAALTSLLFLLVACTNPSPTPPPGASTLTPVPSTLTPDSPVLNTSPLLLFSAPQNGYQRLFAYGGPGGLPLTRLSGGEWDDITPALSPDGRQAAFASSRNNYFDLYLLNLQDGQTLRLTDSPAYEASPSWSPDGQWLAYETYTNDNFDIAILSAQPGGEHFSLTEDPASDQSPAWAPGGRQIAFASDRSGLLQIWTANLDTPGENRFQLVSPNPQREQLRPAWSPNGRFLAWQEQAPGEPAQVMIWDSERPLTPARPLAPGSQPAWNADGSQIAAALEESDQEYLVIYNLDASLRLPPLALGRLRGLSLGLTPFSQLTSTFQRFAFSPTPPFSAQTQPADENPLGRASLRSLPGIDAPQPQLHDAVDESFLALRSRVARETGWDVLASLENAYVPLTLALAPGRGDSWLYTGRAFDLNPLPLNVGWMQVYREDRNGETYWRLFARAQAQDGSAGEPLRLRPWDFAARYTLNPLTYEQGGARMDNLPSGYWVDLTALAQAYGWQRPPAQTNWRTFLGGALFNEFFQPGTLSWREAMLELYPPEVLITPSPVVPATRTPTPTPTGYRYKTPTPSLTSTPTLQPTFTPQP